jgi:ABC-type antimicrobial peptide transport system permease subunit
MALGATAGDVHLLVVREGVRLVAIGVVVGSGIALCTSRLVARLLFVVSPTDALTFTGIPAALVVVAVLACWIPALRATRVDPVTALRSE